MEPPVRRGMEASSQQPASTEAANSQASGLRHGLSAPGEASDETAALESPVRDPEPEPPNGGPPGLLTPRSHEVTSGGSSLQHPVSSLPGDYQGPRNARAT